jgi:peptidylprolyl isomerase
VRSSPRIPVALGLASTLLLLAGCGEDSPSSDATPAAGSPTPSASASATPSSTPSAKVAVAKTLDAITVQGDFGKPPKVSVKTPWRVDKTRTRVLERGSGPDVKPGQTVTVNYVGINGRTGKKFDDSFERGQPASFGLSQVVPGFSKGLVGQRQGSRVLIGIPGADGYDGSGGNPQIDVNVGDSLIFVVDLVAVPLSGPSGAAVKPEKGLPTVSAAGADKAPKITVPKTDPPERLQVQPLIKGKGTKVAENDTITFDYTWVAWEDGRLLEESYTGDPATLPVSGMLPGLRKALTGQTVGSRVLMVIPPSEGYPEGNATPKIDKDETVVIVADILFTQSPM